MTVAVTGAAGFLGRRLIAAILQADGPDRVERVFAADVAPASFDDPRVEHRAGSITDRGFVQALVADADLVYHLAAVLSGQSEAQFDLGLEVNVDATRTLLEACRRQPRPRRVVFSSSIAVFGGPLPTVVPDLAALHPQSSYGTGKAIAELLVAEYSRRGFVDGIACRLPTVAVRPGAPNSALSSFVSGIVREPLAGIEALCPVPLDTPLWVCSPEVVTRNLVHAGRMATAGLAARRSVTLPGLSVTPGQMLDSLERLAGSAVRARVRCESDPRTTRIVSSWPGAFDVTRALALGFEADRDVDAIVLQYIDWYAGQGFKPVKNCP